jgi:uncharacterized membrane protein YGL010W
MTSLKEQIESYAAYHQDSRNKLTHFVGVPLVTFSLLQLLSWFRLVLTPDHPITAATIFFAVVLIYYIKLDWLVAVIQAPFTLLLLLLADRAAVLPPKVSIAVFLVTFMAGWIIQLVGHAFEGRRPALADNILQIFNAPLFLTVEVMSRLGFRRDLVEPSVRAGA